METHFLSMFFALNLMLMATHAALPPELYWKSVLPNTPMPQAITQTLSHEESQSFVWGQQSNASNKLEDQLLSNKQNDGEENAKTYLGPQDNTKTEFGGDQFFLEEDLHPGKELNWHFSKRTYDTPLLARQIAEHMPFSLDKLKEVLNMFSVKPKSISAEIIEKAIRVCETPSLEGEERYCATSLESLVDFVTSKLGKNVDAISTEVKRETKLQKFSVKDGVKKLAEDKGEDGTRVKAVAICHKDTSKWNPKHLAFQVLNLKPGTAPICHFSHESNVVWLPKQTT